VRVLSLNIVHLLVLGLASLVAFLQSLGRIFLFLIEPEVPNADVETSRRDEYNHRVIGLQEQEEIQGREYEPHQDACTSFNERHGVTMFFVVLQHDDANILDNTEDNNRVTNDHEPVRNHNRTYLVNTLDELTTHYYSSVELTSERYIHAAVKVDLRHE
jgi:hypothetical protein